MLLCMRTTIDVNDTVLLAAKKRAAEEKTTLKAVVEAALRAHLSSKPARSDYRVQWRPEKGELMPGVDFTDRDALFDLLDGRS